MGSRRNRVASMFRIPVIVLLAVGISTAQSAQIITRGTGTCGGSSSSGRYGLENTGVSVRQITMTRGAPSSMSMSSRSMSSGGLSTISSRGGLSSSLSSGGLGGELSSGLSRSWSRSMSSGGLSRSLGSSGLSSSLRSSGQSGPGASSNSLSKESGQLSIDNSPSHDASDSYDIGDALQGMNSYDHHYESSYDDYGDHDYHVSSPCSHCSSSHSTTGSPSGNDDADGIFFHKTVSYVVDDADDYHNDDGDKMDYNYNIHQNENSNHDGHGFGGDDVGGDSWLGKEYEKIKQSTGKIFDEFAAKTRVGVVDSLRQGLSSSLSDLSSLGGLSGLSGLGGDGGGRNSRGQRLQMGLSSLTNGGNGGGGYRDGRDSRGGRGGRGGLGGNGGGYGGGHGGLSLLESPPRGTQNSLSGYGREIGDHGDPLFFDSHGMHSYLRTSDVFDVVQDLASDPSVFYVTFACQPKVGKYLCKAQCVKRDEGLTGSCETGYCNCILKEEKKLRKKMNKRFLAAMKGFDTDCEKKSKQCRRFCKNLMPDKSYTGMCTNNVCRCVTYPSAPDKNKKTMCEKAIKKLKKIESKSLKLLGIKAPLEADSLSSSGKADNAHADEVIQKLYASKTIDGCTAEDIQNLRSIIKNMNHGLQYLSSIKTESNAPKTTPSSLKSAPPVSKPTNQLMVNPPPRSQQSTRSWVSSLGF